MKSRAFLVFVGLWLGAMGLFCAVVAAVFVTKRDLWSATVAVGGASSFAGVVIPLFIKTIPGRIAPKVQCDSVGTTFRPDPGIDYPILVSLGGMVLASVLITVLLPIGKLGLPVPPNMRYSLPFTAAFVAVGGVPLLWRNLRRGSTSYLRLTAEGFEIAQGWRPQSAEWSALVDVASEAPNQTKPTPGAIVFVMPDDAAFTLTALGYTPDGAALRDLVRFYWRHPECRDELTDGRAAERLIGELA